MAQPNATSYDDIPYIGKPFSFTHPDRLATAASLLGIEPPPSDGCRVLEPGCGNGANLIPMAESLPHSSFVGIDLSLAHIEEGRRLVEELELSNIELRHMDLADIGTDFGTFDYIICHGVYSWVPPAVQDRILEICSEQLTSHGVAFVSYNTFPGWHMRRMIRDMACFLVQADAEPVVRLQQARELLKVLLSGMAGQTDAYSHLLRTELKRALDAEDHYFFHEHLEEFNAPLYHHEFVQRAADRGMRYLCDAELRLMLPVLGAPEFEQLLQTLATDNVSRSQYSDFLTNRAFRKSLLCHEGQSGQQQPNVAQLMSFYVTSFGYPQSPHCNIHDKSDEVFRAADGTGISVNIPLAKAAFLHLSEISPRRVTVEQLLTRARELLNLPPATGPELLADRQVLGNGLLMGHATAPTSVIDICSVPARFVAEAGERPRISRLARLQASRGQSVTNRRHEPETVDHLHRQILPLLDGTRDRPSLVRELDGLRRQGRIVFPDGVADEAELVDDCLRNIARGFMLIE